MAPELFAHPFSSYCWKVMIALGERGVAYQLRDLGNEPAAREEFPALWPLRRMPVLRHEGRVLIESSIIIEYCDRLGGAAPLLPREVEAALETRFMDRVFDNYVMSPTQAIVADHMRPQGARDRLGVERASALLDQSYDWLEGRLSGRRLATGEVFTLADCAAAPSLFYADWVHQIGAGRPNLSAYRARLLARPAVAAVVEAARPYRHLFPPGAPDRD